MKHTFAALTAICSVAFLTYAPSAGSNPGDAVFGRIFLSFLSAV